MASTGPDGRIHEPASSLHSAQSRLRISGFGSVDQRQHIRPYVITETARCSPGRRCVLCNMAVNLDRASRRAQVDALVRTSTDLLTCVRVDTLTCMNPTRAPRTATMRCRMSR
jgi:hypothetical protein